ERGVVPGDGAAHDFHPLPAVSWDLDLTQPGDLELRPAFPTHQEDGELADVLRVLRPERPAGRRAPYRPQHREPDPRDGDRDQYGDEDANDHALSEPHAPIIERWSPEVRV